MNEQFVSEIELVLAKAPKAEPIPQRSELDWRIDDAFRRMVGANCEQSKMLWASRYVAALKARGALKSIVQGKVSAELEASLVRQAAAISKSLEARAREALREAADQAGERNDQE